MARVLLRTDDPGAFAGALAEVTVRGSRGGFSGWGSSVTGYNPAGSSSSRPSVDADLQPVVVTVAPLPEPIPTVVVTGSVPDDDWNTVQTPSGDDILIGAPKSLPIDLDPLQPPVRSPGPAQTFVGPQPTVPPPQPLPEVVVRAQPPTTARPPPVPTTPIFGLPNPLMLGFYFLFAPRVANEGEDERVAKMIQESAREARRRAAAAIEPVVVSTSRLPEPLPVVTVTADRLAGPATSTFFADPLAFLGRLVGVREAFIPKPTSRIAPKPQTLRSPAPRLRKTKVGTPPNVTPSTTGRSLRVPWSPVAPTIPIPRPDPAPQPWMPPSVFTPDLTPSLSPQLGLQPQQVAPPTSGRCVCTDKKPPRKPRKPRVECWRGTYVETSGGLVKSRKEKVPCR